MDVERTAGRDAVDQRQRPGALGAASPERRPAHAASGIGSPAIGGAQPARAHAIAATTAAAPAALDSPIAPLIDVTTARRPPNTSASACASDAIEAVGRVRAGIHDVNRVGVKAGTAQARAS